MINKKNEESPSSVRKGEVIQQSYITALQLVT